MVIVEAVLETEPATDFTAWPVAILPDSGFMALSGHMAPDQIGAAMAVVLTYNGIPTEPASDLTAEVLRRHLIESEGLIAPGGLRFRDTATEAEVVPGCCFGLESWRDWQDVVHGDHLWLGHSPSFRLEHCEGMVRIWNDDGHPASSPILGIELVQLPHLLIAVQQQLSEFLTLAGQWAADVVPQCADTLIAALGEDLRITEPTGGR